MSRRMELRWGATTHTGRVRTGNEDAFLAGPQLFVVADGMGGHNAGEVASAMAVATLQSGAVNGLNSAAEMQMLIRGANAAIYAASITHSDQRGMGTTVTTLARLNGDNFEVVVANVGDSRTYLKRGGRFERITIDHSYVQTLVNEGVISLAEARTHPRRNIVTRALGIEADVVVDTQVIEVQHGDRFVLCSDGLVDEADDEEIDTVLYSHDYPQTAAADLVELALEHGGRDNVTVVVVDVVIYDETPVGGMPTPEILSNVDLENLSGTTPDNTAGIAVGQPLHNRFSIPIISAFVVGVAAVVTLVLFLIT